jgi:hypothetical protein
MPPSTQESFFVEVPGFKQSPMSKVQSPGLRSKVVFHFFFSTLDLDLGLWTCWISISAGSGAEGCRLAFLRSVSDCKLIHVAFERNSQAGQHSDNATTKHRDNNLVHIASFPRNTVRRADGRYKPPRRHPQASNAPRRGALTPPGDMRENDEQPGANQCIIGDIGLRRCIAV